MKFNKTRFLLPKAYIEDVPGGKVNIVGGLVSVILSKKVYMYMYPIPNGFRDTVITLYICKVVDKKEILRTVSNAGIYCSSDKVGTVYLVPTYFRKFHHQHQCTLQLV
jgi:hypothetical protein